MRSREERERELLEEVKTLLKEKGKPIDPEVMARLTAIHGGGEDSLSRYASVWRAVRGVAVLVLFGLIALLFFYLNSR